MSQHEEINLILKNIGVASGQNKELGRAIVYVLALAHFQLDEREGVNNFTPVAPPGNPQEWFMAVDEEIAGGIERSGISADRMANWQAAVAVIMSNVKRRIEDQDQPFASKRSATHP